MTLTAGNRVRVRLEGSGGEWCDARVVIASQTNPSSVMLQLFGAVRAGHADWIANALPLSIDYQQGTVVSIFGDRYEIEVAEIEVTPE